MHDAHDRLHPFTRRRFLTEGGNFLGGAALASMIGADSLRAADRPTATFPHHAAKAKNVIFLHMVGGPPQMDLFDYKPRMVDYFNVELPESVRMGQRLTTMTSGQDRLPIAPAKFEFSRRGKNGIWVSELLPWTAKIVDELCFVRSMHTDAINHEPGITMMQTGSQTDGRPCLGSWASYGLGSLNRNLPTFVVLVTQWTSMVMAQPLSAKLWHAGCLPGENAGVSFRSIGDSIPYVNNPPGVPSEVRRVTLDGLNAFNAITERRTGDPETQTRIRQYEMAFRMQASVPELTDLSKEPAAISQLYGEAVRKPGTFANAALMARRLVERGVRFVQIYHNGWDLHQNLNRYLPDQCRDIDRPCFGLIQDLKQRGLLDDTLVIWGGEFGRTIYSQGSLNQTNSGYGRDHHSRCFTMWMAGGGTRPGQVYGETDDFSYNVVKDPVHVRDFHATVLHLLGFDHERFSVRHQGLEQRLTGVERARVVRELLA